MINRMFQFKDDNDYLIVLSKEEQVPIDKNNEVFLCYWVVDMQMTKLTREEIEDLIYETVLTEVTI